MTPPPTTSRRRAATVAICAALLTAAVAAPRAVADILPATTIAGPSSTIVGFGGAAMAEDGTGGVVYLQRVNGVPHVFVSRLVGGQWQPPIQVDYGEPFAASWARIGAAVGGELIVVWATPFAVYKERPRYELLGALLGPGGSSFGPATIVDPDIEEANGTNPDLEVSSSGQADVAYRVVEAENRTVPLQRPSDVVESVRLAHFDGTRWVDLGAINRDPGVSMRAPTAANAPKLAIGPTGNAVVVWQEPELEGTARIWARRIFGTSIDYVMPVTANSYNGQPLTQDADAPAVAFSRLGQAEVAYRQTAGPGSPLPGPRIFLNILSDGEATSGAEFGGASIVDGEVSGGQAAAVGPPSIDIDERQSMRLMYDSNGTPRVVEATDRGISGRISLGPPFAGAEPYAVSVMNPEGGGVSAWPSVEGGGHPAVAVREDFPDGSLQTALVSGGPGGEVGELSVGRSTLGDGLIAFRQGPFGNAAIVAAQVSAPPAQVPFVLSAPKGWVRPSQAVISWVPAPSASGPLTYHLVLDGHVRPTPAGALTAKLDTRGLGSGHHQVQVLATDSFGQSTLTAPAELLVDGTPPNVSISAGRFVRVRVHDCCSGVDTRAVRVSWGDGERSSDAKNLRHRYSHPGVYLVSVRVRDKIGVSGTVHRWVNAG